MRNENKNKLVIDKAIRLKYHGHVLSIDEIIIIVNKWKSWRIWIAPEVVYYTYSVPLLQTMYVATFINYVPKNYAKKAADEWVWWVAIAVGSQVKTMTYYDVCFVFL